MESATRGLRARFLTLTRPFAVLKRTCVPSKSTHTGVTCGAPSGPAVARCANAFFVKRSRYCSWIVAMASWSQIRRAESIPLDARPAAGPQGAQGGPPMLYIAFVKNKPRWQLGDVDLTAKSRQWWNEGEKAAAYWNGYMDGAVRSGERAS